MLPFDACELYVMGHTALARMAPFCDAFTLALIMVHTSITTTQRYCHPQAAAVDAAFSKFGNRSELVTEGGHQEKVLPSTNGEVELISNLVAYRLSGERGRNRTFNLLIKSQLLCQLSYAPACGFSFALGSSARLRRAMGDCSCCSREAALRNHRVGRMRIPMKNITQPVTMLPMRDRLEKRLGSHRHPCLGWERAFSGALLQVCREWRHRVGNASIGLAWRGNRRTLFQSSEQRSISQAIGFQHRDKPVPGAHGVDTLLLAPREDLHRQSFEVAENPQQIKPLGERRIEIPRSQGSEHTQHTLGQFFYPHDGIT
jgi:hypothetical protein